MKNSISLFLIFLFVLNLQNSFAQNDTLCKKSPLSIEATYVGDAVSGFSGGIQKGSTYLGMANFKVGMNTQHAGLWKRGELFINAAITHGGTPSLDFIGDLQTASNIEAGNLTYLHELWYKQNFRKFTFIAGLQDLCAEFVSGKSTALFLNSSFGVHSSISGNLPVPIFPLTSLGMQIHFKFSEKLTAKFAIFDGLPDDFDTNPHNLSWKLTRDDGYLSFTEITLTNLIKNSSATYKIGFYYHNSHKIAVSSENEIAYMPENYGFYLVMDQLLVKTGKGKELTVFSQLGVSPKSINNNWYYIGGGLNFNGLLKKTKKDELGLGFAAAGLQNEIGNETTIELTYKTSIHKNIFIQPDLQYIINPAGSDKKLDNAVVGILRLGINF